MPRQPFEMERRRDAAQATLDRFIHVPFRLGDIDCAQMAIFHCRKLGRPLKLGKVARYNSPQSAVRALAKLGFARLADVLDSHFPRIPWAFARTGDLLLMPADDDDANGLGANGLGALAVALGNGRALLYHEDAPGAVVAEVVEAETAWRLIGDAP